MNRPLTRALCRLGWRPAAVLTGGVGLAVLAEGSSVALLALSGWFIASCYLSGAGLLPGFSYLAPSGGVRAFATSRVLARYTANLVAHSATLSWLTRLRTSLFSDAARAGPERMRRLGTGEALDRAMSDADTLDHVLIRAVVPALLAVVGVASAAAVIAAVSRPASVAFLAGGALTAVMALCVGRAPDPATRRGAARAGLVDTVDAWDELACLGAIDALRAAGTSALAALAAAEDGADRARSRTALAIDLGVAATTVAVLAGARLGPAPAPLADAALVTLLTVGTLEIVAGLASARLAWRAAATAAERLAVLTTPPTTVATAREAQAGSAAGAELTVQQLVLSPDGRSAPELTARFAGGRLTLVHGRSGTGKTTLLRALAGELSRPGVLVGGRPPAHYRPGEIVLVPHDDHVFTGTVATNLRLADPDLSDVQACRLLDALRLTERGIDPETPVGVGGRTLSGGEHRRLCLARALAARPQVLLVDEPTEGLDTATANHVLSGLRALLPEATVVAVIHDRQADTLTALDADRISLDTTVRADVAQHYS